MHRLVGRSCVRMGHVTGDAEWVVIKSSLFSLGEGWTNFSPLSKSDSSSLFANKDLLEDSHSYMFTHCLYLRCQQWYGPHSWKYLSDPSQTTHLPCSPHNCELAAPTCLPTVRDWNSRMGQSKRSFPPAVSVRFWVSDSKITNTFKRAAF